MTWIFRLLRIYFSRQLRRRGVLAYLKGVQAGRRMLVLTILCFLAMELMVVSAVGALVTGVWLLDLATTDKLTYLFITFLCLFLVPALGLVFGLSERVWFRLSGAQKLVRQLRE